jgi:acetyl esterase/lipase
MRGFVNAVMRAVRAAPRISDGVSIRFARRFFRAPAFIRRRFTRGLTVEQVTLGGVPCEVLAPPRAGADRAVLYLHGGGYFCGSPLSYRHLTGWLARALGCRVFVPDYRLAPEHPFPAAADDALAAWGGLAAGHPGAKLALIGDSAGGGLALATLVAARGRGLALPACAVLLSPWADLALTGDSNRDNAATDVLFRADEMPHFASLYLGNAPPDDPRASPLYADLSGLPPVLVHVSSSELLRDDGLRVCDRLTAAGGICESKVGEDLPHVWHLLLGLLPESARDLKAVAAFVATYIGVRPGRNGARVTGG